MSIVCLNIFSIKSAGGGVNYWKDSQKVRSSVSEINRMISLNRYDDAIQLYDRILQEDSTNTVSLKDFSELQWLVV